MSDDAASPCGSGLSDQLGAWVRVSERLPDIDVPVWLYLPDGPDIIQGCRVEDADGWYWANCYNRAFFDQERRAWASHEAEMDDAYEPTLWQPLPEPPERDA